MTANELYERALSLETALRNKGKNSPSAREAAMATAEATLTTKDEQRRYEQKLWDLTGCNLPQANEYFLMATATALQRAEAFLRCKGLWEQPAPAQKPGCSAS